MLRASRSSTIEGKAGALHVESVGGGARPLLAITPLGAEWLRRALPGALEDLFSISIVELPGTGRSDGDAATATVDDARHAVGDAIEELGLERPILFGHSMNGTLALAAAGDTRLSGVIAACSPPSLSFAGADASTQYWADMAEPARQERAAELTARHEATDDAAERRELFDQLDRLRRWYDPDLDSAELDEVTDLPLGWIQAVFQSAASFDWAAALARVSVPVFLGLGRYDFIVPPVVWDTSHGLDELTISVFERSGHTAFYEEPDAFTRRVADWLTTTVTRGRA